MVLVGCRRPAAAEAQRLTFYLFYLSLSGRLFTGQNCTEYGIEDFVYYGLWRTEYEINAHNKKD